MVFDPWKGYEDIFISRWRSTSEVQMCQNGVGKNLKQIVHAMVRTRMIMTMLASLEVNSFV